MRVLFRGIVVRYVFIMLKVYTTEILPRHRQQRIVLHHLNYRPLPSSSTQ